jgi:hypothetical protein
MLLFSKKKKSFYKIKDCNNPFHSYVVGWWQASIAIFYMILIE